MPEETPIKTLKAITIKTEQESVDRFSRLREELGFATSGQFFTELLDRFEQPQQVADRTGDLQRQLAEMSTRYEGEHAINESLNAEIASLRQQLEDTRHDANTNAEVASAQQLAFEKQLADLKPKEGQALISFTPDNLKVLDLVCARESRRRKQPWSRSHVINYFINARFVRGLLNGDLQSIPDSELRRLGVSLKNPGKEDFDL